MRAISRVERLERTAGVNSGCPVCDFYAFDRFIFKHLEENECSNCGADLLTFKIAWDEEMLAARARLDTFGDHAAIVALAATDAEVRSLVELLDGRLEAQRAVAERRVA